LDDNLPYARLFSIRMVDDHYGDVIQFLSIGFSHFEYTTAQKKQLVVCAANFQLIAGQLYKLGLDEILRRYVLEHERSIILVESHDGLAGGHYVEKATVRKILRAGLWSPTLHKDAKEYCQTRDICQRMGKPNRRDEMSLIPQSPINPPGKRTGARYIIIVT